MSVCDRDCFKCVYEDCICDELNAEDYALQRMVEREITLPKTIKEKEIAAKKKAYYEANRDEIAAKQKAYREANRDEIAAKKKAYREANRDEYNAYMREYLKARRKQRRGGNRREEKADLDIYGAGDHAQRQRIYESAGARMD